MAKAIRMGTRVYESTPRRITARVRTADAPQPRVAKRRGVQGFTEPKVTALNRQWAITDTVNPCALALFHF
jgi:hypothetical protein